MKRLVLTSKCDEILKQCDEILLVLFELMIEGVSDDELLGARQVFIKMYENIIKEEQRNMEENK